MEVGRQAVGAGAHLPDRSGYPRPTAVNRIVIWKLNQLIIFQVTPPVLARRTQAQKLFNGNLKRDFVKFVTPTLLAENKGEVHGIPLMNNRTGTDVFQT